MPFFKEEQTSIKKPAQSISQTSACPICLAHEIKPLISFLNIPLTGVFCRSPNEKKPVLNLEINYCLDCAFLNQRRIKNRIDYSNVTRPTARQLPEYASEIIKILSQNNPSKFLIEVGCNDGTFLGTLQKQGFSNLLGIEPSRVLAEKVKQQGHKVFPGVLDLSSAKKLVARRGKANAVVCRHTLEHVPDPLQFLGAIRHLLADGGLVCIEVPSARPILDHMHAHEIWDEHLSYFLPENLSYALNKAGFAVKDISVKSHLEMENIIVWARPCMAGNPKIPDMRERVKTCANLSRRWEVVREKVLEIVRTCPRPLVALGASHPQSNFLNFSGVSPWVDMAIDDDPAKVGLWLPLKGKNVPIVPSSQLKEVVTGGTLLLTAFGYPQWMEEASKAVAGHAKATVDMSQLAFES